MTPYRVGLANPDLPRPIEGVAFKANAPEKRWARARYWFSIFPLHTQSLFLSHCDDTSILLLSLPTWHIRSSMPVTRAYTAAVDTMVSLNNEQTVGDGYGYGCPFPTPPLPFYRSTGLDWPGLVLLFQTLVCVCLPVCVVCLSVCVCVCVCVCVVCVCL